LGKDRYRRYHQSQDLSADSDKADTKTMAGAFFGRRHGKKLRQEQARGLAGLFPQLALDCSKPLVPESLFATPRQGYWLEIGFGGGEHLLRNAQAHPEIGHLGCEPFINGLAKLVAAIGRDGLDNIRLHDDDALQVLDQLPDASLDRIYLLYPDPWPKRRHHKRRFVSDTMLGHFARVLKPGGLFCFASDIDHYVGWTLARLLRSPHFDWCAEEPADWKVPWAGWQSTRYEAKALREGRVPSYITARRRSIG
jgi:tRNA (guanine-N7-)-methyltransferase